MPTNDEMLRQLYANYYPSNEDVLMGDPGTAPLGALAPLTMKSFFPKLFNLSKELPFQEREAIARAVPGYVKSIAGNKSYDFSGREVVDLIKRLSKMPQRYASNTKLLDKTKEGSGVADAWITSVLKNTPNRELTGRMPDLRAAEGALKSGNTGTSNLYAALVGQLEKSGFLNPYEEAKKLLGFAGYAGIK